MWWGRGWEKELHSGLMDHNFGRRGHSGVGWQWWLHSKVNLLIWFSLELCTLKWLRRYGLNVTCIEHLIPQRVFWGDILCPLRDEVSLVGRSGSLEGKSWVLCSSSVQFLSYLCFLLPRSNGPPHSPPTACLSSYDESIQIITPNKQSFFTLFSLCMLSQ